MNLIGEVNLIKIGKIGFPSIVGLGGIALIYFSLQPFNFALLIFGVGLICLGIWSYFLVCDKFTKAMNKMSRAKIKAAEEKTKTAYLQREATAHKVVLEKHKLTNMVAKKILDEF